MNRCLHAIRHVAFEDLGCLDGLARARGFVPQYTEAVDVPESGFAWESVDPVVVLGGPIGVNDGDEYPCVNAAIDGLRRRLAKGLPTLGICLGAQLIAAALGARVWSTGTQHVGWWPVERIAASSPLRPLKGCPVLHWHGDTFELPRGATRLAGTDDVPNQAFALGDNAIMGLQFHIEVTPRAIEQWLIGHHTQLGQLGIAPSLLRAQTAQYAADMERAAHQIIGPWLEHGAVSALLLVAACLAAGVLVARVPHPAGLVAAFNWWVLNIALPALVLVQITQLEWSASLLWPAVAMWIVFLGAWLYVALLGRLAGWRRGEIGALVLTCGLGNTSFIGYPLIEALRGEAGLGIAVVADQLGSFLLLSTLGLLVAALYAGTHVQPRQMLRRVVTFPAFIALVVAGAMQLTGIDMGDSLRGVLSRLGDTLTPLALFSVGLQLRLRMNKADASRVVGGLSWKLLGAPLVVLAATLAIGPSSMVAAVTVMQAGMAPMITAGILAQQYGLAPVLANRVVGYGIVLSLASVPFIHFVM